MLKARAAMPPEFSQAAFAAAVLDPEAAMPAGLTSHSGRVSQRRFDVYRNNVLSGLTRALASRFPVCERIVGEAFFRMLALHYVRREPPKSALLLQYGATLSDFIATFEPAAELPWLADVARFEHACGLASHAADAPVLTGADMAAVPQQDWGGLRLRLHPAAHLLRSIHPGATIYRMNRAGATPGPVDFGIAEDALVTRPLYEINLRSLAPGEYEFLTAIERGETLEDSMLAGTAVAGFEVAAAMVMLLTSGVACSLVTPS